MIERHWRGICKADAASDYVRYLKAETFKKLSRLKGFISASILRRQTTTGLEFLIITRWKDMASIQTFAGDDPDLAVVPGKVRKMMIRFDRRATHFEVVQ